MQGTEVQLNNYYKWQFLRRNKNYQKDYDIYNQSLADGAEQEELELSIKLFSRWKISLCFDYTANEFPIGLTFYFTAVNFYGPLSLSEIETSTPIEQKNLSV